MTPVNSLIRHIPEDGQTGDCHRACIASLLDLPAHRVPHFFVYPMEEGGDRGNAHQEAWLGEMGMAFIEFPLGGMDDGSTLTLSRVLSWMGTYAEGVHYLLIGESKAGMNHSVVCHEDKIVHDPTYGEPHGIVGPAIEGVWWLGFIAKKL